MLRILIADDSPLVRERLAALVSAVGDVDVVDQTRDVRGTIWAIQRTRPDVVVLDVRLGEGDGLQVLKAIEAGDSPPVVIVLTAFPYPQYRQRFMEAGAAYFMDKATEFDQIVQVLEALVEESHP